MQIYHLKDYTNGWFVGNFMPTIIKTEDVEIAIHELPMGHKSDGHYHKVAHELNLILDGRIRFGNTVLQTGAIFLYEPGEKTDLICLEDCQLLVCKFPSVVGDKFYDDNT